jgi:hypothetical protein
MSWTVSYQRASSTLYINNYCKATLRLAKMQDQKSLTLHLGTFSGWGREPVDIVFAPQGGQYTI